MNIPYDTGVSHHLGSYSDGIEVPSGGRLLFSSGTPGFDAAGNLPADFSDEATNAWANVTTLLETAGFSLADVVKVNTTLTRSADIPAYRDVRTKALGDLRPAFMLQVVPQLVRADLRVEIEIVAAKGMAGA